MSQSSAHALI